MPFYYTAIDVFSFLSIKNSFSFGTFCSSLRLLCKEQKMEMRDLLTKYFTGDITGEEKETLFRELGHDDELKKDFCAMQNILALAEALPEENDESVGADSYRSFAARLKKRRMKQLFLHAWRYAAVVCLVAASAYFLTLHWVNKERNLQFTEISAPSGQRVKVTLPDGTTAWIGPCSTLRYANSFNHETRNVELSGSTYFDVAHNPDKPFRVSTGRYMITVLGTRFNAMAYPENEHFEVDLIEGSVQIDNLSDDTDRLVLKPLEQAIIKNNRLYKKISNFDNEEYLKNGVVHFKRCLLGEVLKKVSLWQGVGLTIDNEVDVNYPVTGKIRQSDSLESILRALQSVVRFHYEIIDEKHIRIYR